jgi:hypothetical protein
VTRDTALDMLLIIIAVVGAVLVLGAAPTIDHLLTHGMTP